MAKRKPQSKSPVNKQVKKKSTKRKLVPSRDFLRKNWMPALILAILPVLIYFQTFGFGYVLDDKIVIQDNQYTKAGLSGVKDIFSTESFQGYFGEQKDLLPGARYRPLSIATFALEIELFGQKPQISHIINVFLYLLTGLLLFRILGMLFLNKAGHPWFFSVAFLGALFWILHPVHTEVVANIKGRDEIMALLGSLGALYFSLSYIYWKGYYKIALASIFFFLGLMAKENTITFLAVIPLTLHFFTASKFKDYITVIVPMMIMTAIYFAIRYNVIGYILDSGQEFNDIMNNPFVGMNFGEKYATIFYTLLEYIRLAFFPHPLTHDYYPFHIPTMNWSDIGSLFSLLIYVALTGFGLWGLLKKNIYAYFVLVYLATLSIVSNVFVGVGTTMNERFIYITTIATCLLIAYFLVNELYSKKEQWKKLLALGLAGLFVIGFSLRSVLRVPDWENALTLNRSAIKVSKNSARANCFMGTALFENYKTATDRDSKMAILEEADQYITRSIELFPKYLNGNIMKAGVVAEGYKFHNDIDQLLAGFKLVAERRPDTGYLHEYFDYLNGRGGNHEKLINFYYDVGKRFLYDQTRNYTWSAKYLLYAHQLNPNNREVNHALGNTYSALNRPADAQKYFNLANAVQ